MSTAELDESYAGFYRPSPFVSVDSEPPRLKDVVGTNRCRLGVAADGTRAVVLSVIDNLTKGAAGQALQNMNLMFGLDERTGLEQVALLP
jgi:N-acetyl-gamma-glutamyl-phosphate reductase